MRFATHNLPPQEFGLWSFVFACVGYLFLLELGVGASLSRHLGEPIGSGDLGQASGWFTLAFVTMLLQTVVIFIIGYALSGPIVEFSNIDPALHADMYKLWMWVLISRCVLHPFTTFAAVLYAQNRVYLQNTVGVVASCVQLAVFWFQITHGHGVFAYGYSMAASSLILIIGWWLAVALGPHSIGLSWRSVPWDQFSHVFGYSLGLFVIIMAPTITTMTTTILLTRILGLDASAIYNVTSRFAVLSVPLFVRPFEAFLPRWQMAVCENKPEYIRTEFHTMFRFTMLFSFVACGGILLINREFVQWWTKPEYYGGFLLNAMLALNVLSQAFRSCYIPIFNLFKRIRGVSLVIAINLILEISLVLLLVHIAGIASVPIAAVCAGLLCLTWFLAIFGSRLVQINPTFDILREMKWCGPFLILAFGISYFLQTSTYGTSLLRLVISSSVALLLALPLVIRAGLLLRQLKGTAAPSRIAE